MNRCFLFLICLAFSITNFAQIAKPEGQISTIPLINNKVLFMKEVVRKNKTTQEANFGIIGDWVKTRYGNDPFQSSLRYDLRNFEILIKTRTELILPPNSNGIREKMVLRYRINTFLYQDKCVIEITDLVYMYENTKSTNILPKTIRAEEFITDEQIKVQDSTRELKINTRKSTILLINNILTDFKKQITTL